jgi:lysophospholipid acyltransferase (LPLAT)-like uncharacterized protein
VAYTLQQRITLAVVPRLAALFIRVLGLTLRYEDVADPGVTKGHEVPGPCVYAFWHRTLLTCAHRFRGLDIAILISRSFDGELIARTVELLGFRAIRGSSSRGGATALRQMATAYNEGFRCAITADGPRGPSQVAKPGPVQLAELVGAPEIGVYYALPDRAWVLKTWDRFLIPKPFSTVKFTWPSAVPSGDLSLLQAALDKSVTMTGEVPATGVHTPF